MRDNPTNERHRRSFWKDHRTRTPIYGKRWLFEWVGQDASIPDGVMKPGRQLGVDRQAFERYLNRVVVIREKVVVLVVFVFRSCM
jgi:hypothetical protein